MFEKLEKKEKQADNSKFEKTKRNNSNLPIEKKKCLPSEQPFLLGNFCNTNIKMVQI